MFHFRCAAIRIPPQEPDLYDLPDKARDWEGLVYDKVLEVLYVAVPEPLRKCVVVVGYHDDNLHHNMLTSRSVTGVLHLVNKSPID